MNQQPDREDEAETQPLPDLPLSGEQAEETAGGPSFLSYPTFQGGVFVGSGD